MTADQWLADLRRDGWRVAAHNDYMQYGALFTFWLMVRGEVAVKGEGKTDEYALREITEKVIVLNGRLP